MLLLSSPSRCSPSESSLKSRTHLLPFWKKCLDSSWVGTKNSWWNKDLWNLSKHLSPFGLLNSSNNVRFLKVGRECRNFFRSCPICPFKIFEKMSTTIFNFILPNGEGNATIHNEVALLVEKIICLCVVVFFYQYCFYDLSWPNLQ